MENMTSQSVVNAKQHLMRGKVIKSLGWVACMLYIQVAWCRVVLWINQWWRFWLVLYHTCSRGYSKTVIGRCFNPRVQEMKSLLHMMPRIWGLEGSVLKNGTDCTMSGVKIDRSYLKVDWVI